jgi:hypothetical protein
VAKPCDQARRLQALPRSALAGRLHQCLETMGGEQGTGLSPRLRQRPRLHQQESSRQAAAGRPPPAVGPRRHALAPHPPRRPARRRPTPAQSRPGQLPRTDGTSEHARSFGHMVAHLQGDPLPTWIESATSTTDLPSLRHFAQHLERDLDAVIAGLTLPWNSGVVEGHVNRIKMLKPRCSAARDSNSFANESCWRDRESCARRSGPEPEERCWSTFCGVSQTVMPVGVGASARVEHREIQCRCASCPTSVCP